MARSLLTWWRRLFAPVRRRPYRRPRLERLEDRTLLSGDTLLTAAMLPFTAFRTAHAAGFLATANEVDLYEIQLNRGDRITAAISAQSTGSGLQSLLRVFDNQGNPLALDDQEGGDPQLTFQAANAGDYFIGVSSDGDDAYDPTTANSGHGGTSTGLYALNLNLTPDAPLLADVTGSAFRLTSGNTAAYGDTISGTFTIENRGGATSTGFTVQLMLSTTALFNSNAIAVPLTPFQLASGPPAELAAGQSYTDQFTAQLPSTSPENFSSTSGPLFVGLVITPNNPAQDAGTVDKSGVHRGEDWESLTIVTPTVDTGGNNNLTDAIVLGDINLNNRVDGVLTAGLPDFYELEVGVPGLLQVSVAATDGSTFVPRLTLLGSNGEELYQSDQGSIDQQLFLGSYFLEVSGGSTVGAYRLVTTFEPTNSTPFANPDNTGPQPIAVADLNGDGIPDMIVVSSSTNEVTVEPGLGDGTFGQGMSYTVDYYPVAVAVADLNGDGKPDFIVADYGTGFEPGNRLSILINNGDGTFQQAENIILPHRGPVAAVDYGPRSVAVADLFGDGIPDLIVSNGKYSYQPPGASSSSTYYPNTISVLQGNGDGTFQSPQNYVVGPKPAAVVAADLNGDGTPDILVANSGGDMIGVLLNNGDGTFQPVKQTVLPGGFTNAIAVADLSGDGKPDLIVGYNQEHTLGVLPGNGDGTFGAAQTIPIGFDPDSVAVADVNGDGKLDLITANYLDNSVSVLLGNGDGTFQNQQTVPTGRDPTSVIVSDLNGDGKPDLVVSTKYDFSNQLTDNFSVLLGDGDGSFQSAPMFATGSEPTALATAVLTGDGNTDLVITNFNSDDVSVLLGNGDGTFQNQTAYPLPAGQHPVAVAVADVNDDGRLDLIVLNDFLSVSSPYSTVSVLLGNGDGTFQPQKTVFKGDGLYTSLAVADLNGDGTPDIVVTNFTKNTISVLMGNGDGTFQAPEIIAVGNGPDSVAVADLGNGHLDLVVANENDGTLTVLLGDGHGSFPTQKIVSLEAPPLSVQTADVNGDGIPDLIVGEYDSYSYTGGVQVLLGKGDGTFTSSFDYPNLFGKPTIAVADLEGDGIPDLILTNSYYSTVNDMEGNGDGTFGLPTLITTGSTPVAVAVADVNNDGRPDLLVVNQGTDSVEVLLGNTSGFETPQTLNAGNHPNAVTVYENFDGTSDIFTANPSTNSVSVLLVSLDGTFQGPISYPVGPEPVAVQAADLNGDGYPDIVTANFYSPNGYGTVSVLLNNQDGTFAAAETYDVGFEPTSVAVADLTGDGIPDLIVANSNYTVSVLIGNGDGTFQPAETIPTPRLHPLGNNLSESHVVVADVSGDGKPDLIVTSAYSNSVSVLLGNGDGTFQTGTVYPTGSDPVSVALGYLRGDGNLDIVTANYDSNSVSVLFGNGDGTFSTGVQLAVGVNPSAVQIGEFEYDNNPELVVTNASNNTVSVLLSNGDGTFQPQQFLGVGKDPTDVAVADLNGDGLPDIVTANYSGNSVSVLLATESTFTPTTPLTGVSVTDTPNLADLTGDGIPDSVILDSLGQHPLPQGIARPRQPVRAAATNQRHHRLQPGADRGHPGCGRSRGAARVQHQSGYRRPGGRTHRARSDGSEHRGQFRGGDGRCLPRPRPLGDPTPVRLQYLAVHF